MNHNNKVDRPEKLSIDFSAVIKRRSYATLDDRTSTTIEYDGWGPDQKRPFSGYPVTGEATRFTVHVKNEDAYEQIMRSAVRHCNSR